MDYSILIAALALGLSAIAFFYNLGRDTKHQEKSDPEENKLDQIYDRLQEVGGKVDKIIEWQREAASIHASHGEQIKTLFNRVQNLESRMEDREVMTAALQKILERMV